MLPVRADDTAARDLAMLIAGETSGRPLSEVLAEFDRSRSAYYEKLRRFRKEGLAGLMPLPPGPRKPWRRTMEVVAFIVGARVRDPGLGAQAIADQLARQGDDVSVRSVERTLTQFGLTQAKASPR